MRHLALFLVAALTPSVAHAQHFTQPGRITTLSAPVLLDTTDLFRERFAKVGDDMYIAGQPTEQGLREAKARGVTTVVNLRTPEEMQRSVKFDEAAVVSRLGMKYVYLPVRGDSAYPYTPETVTKLADAIRGANGNVLLHCTIAWRASHLWAAYLIRDRGIPVDEALANARAINLMDTMRMGTGGKQPVEEFLGRTLSTLGRPGK